MSIHFNLSVYWLLLPVFMGLCLWVFTPRDEERSTGFMPDLGPLLRLVVAVIGFVLLLCGMLAYNLWLK